MNEVWVMSTESERSVASEVWVVANERETVRVSEMTMHEGLG